MLSQYVGIIYFKMSHNTYIYNTEVGMLNSIHIFKVVLIILIDLNFNIFDI